MEVKDTKFTFSWNGVLVSFVIYSDLTCLLISKHMPGGGIIDMMNTRLQNRLTESEILKIFSDTVEVSLTSSCFAI